MDTNDKTNETVNELEVFPGAPAEEEPSAADETPAVPEAAERFAEGSGSEASSPAAEVPDHSAQAAPATPKEPEVNPWNGPVDSDYGKEPEVNPWNGPVDPSYGESAASATGRRGIGMGVVVALGVAAVVLAVAIAFVGPHLLKPAEPARGDDPVFEGIDPLDHDTFDDDFADDLFDEDAEDIENYLNEGEDLTYSGAVSPEELDEQERAIYDVADERLAALVAADPVETSLIAALVSEGFADQMEIFTLSDCGVDAEEYARVMLEDMSYTINDVYANYENDAALVRATVTCRDVFSVIDEFNTLMDVYKSSEEYAVSSYEEDIERVGIMFMEAARRAPLNDGYAMDLVLRNVDGAWKIDEESWEADLDYLFDVE